MRWDREIGPGEIGSDEMGSDAMGLGEMGFSAMGSGDNEKGGRQNTMSTGPGRALRRAHM